MNSSQMDSGEGKQNNISESMLKALNDEWNQIVKEVKDDPQKEWMMDSPEWRFARVLKGFSADLALVLDWLKGTRFKDHWEGIANSWNSFDYPKNPLGYLAQLAKEDFNHPDLILGYSLPCKTRQLAHLAMIVQREIWGDCAYPICQNEFGAVLGVDQPTVSKQIRKLLQIGWLIQRAGKRREGECFYYYVPAAFK